MQEKGCVWLRSALCEKTVLDIQAICGRGNRRIDLTALSTIIAEKITDKIVSLRPGAFPVRTTFFDKTKTENWALKWHQDRIIPVAEKHDLPGYINWTRKAGVWHCEPPIEVLEKLIFAQIYLDDVDQANGPTEFAVGSHKFGRIPAADIPGRVSASQTLVCTASRGDILVASALALHRSRPATSDGPRRILRIDFANFDLLAPIKWA